MSDSGEKRAALRTRPMFWVAVLLVAALAVGFLWRPEGQRGSTAHSSFQTTPGGVAALARGIERLGRHAEPRITPLVDADPVRGTVVLLRPRLSPSPREIGALLDRVRAGGALIYAPPYIPGRRATRRTPLMDSLRVYHRLLPGITQGPGMLLQEPRWHDHPLAEALALPETLGHGLRVVDEEGRDAGPDSASAAGAPFVQPLLTAQDRGGREWMVAAELSLGEGRVAVFADAYPLSNARVVDDPRAALAVRAALVYTSEADTVFFDEYHQGIRTSRTRADILAEFFFDTPRGRGLLHLIVVCFAVLACAGLRFGTPGPAVAPPDRERRSPLEHVSALGDLYRKAGAAETAALLLVARLARVARHPPPRDAAQADALLRRLNADEGADTPLARARRGLGADPPDLTAIAAGIDEHLSRRFGT